MRVLLSGTSNSVLARGLNYPLTNDSRVSKFTNYSYGASGSVALGDHLRKMDFLQQDFCILDYCVNEEVFIWQKQSHVDAAMNNLNAAIDAASRNRCQPIVLMLLTTKRADYARPFEEAIVAELSTRGVPVFNFYEFARNLTHVTDLEFEDLFLDRMHIRRELGYFIGQAVLDYMERSKDKQLTSTSSDLRYQPIGFVPLEEIDIIGSHELIHAKTKLLKTKLSRILPEAQIILKPRGRGSVDSEIIGLTCNAARTVGTLSDATTGQQLHEIMPTGLFTKARGLTLVSRPLKTPIQFKASKAVIEYTWQTCPLAEHQPDPALELSGFILRTVGQENEMPVHIATCETGPVALHEQVSEAQLQSLADLLLSNPAA